MTIIEIKNEALITLETNKSGTLNENVLSFAKRTTLFNTLRNYENALVNHFQEYPKDSKSEVRLECDFVIIDSETFKRLKSYEKEVKHINIEIKP